MYSIRAEQEIAISACACVVFSLQILINMVPLQVVMKLLCLLPMYLSQRALADNNKRLHVSAPSNPVRAGGILAVHCQVWDLTAGEEVTLFRRTAGQADIERLTWDGGYAVGVEERVFIAERHVGDGSLVYFLTITDVVKIDEGDYTCMVFSSKTMQPVASQTLSIQIYHFPEDPDPQCGPGDNVVFTEGDIIPLNCSSRAGLPTVELTWRRNGGKPVISQTLFTERDGFVYAQLAYRVTRYDNGAVLVCELRSRAFPEETKNCHVGPLKVSFTPRDDDDDLVVDDTDTWLQPDYSMNSPPTDINLDGSPNKNGDGITSSSGLIDVNRCKQECSLVQTPVSTWILLTFVIGGIAAILLIIGLVLLVKLQMFRDTDHHHHLQDSQHAAKIALNYAPKTQVLSLRGDDVYEELEGRRQGETRMYMALHLSENAGKNVGQCVGDPAMMNTSKHAS